MKTSQLKALVKKAGLYVSQEKAVGFTRAAKRTTQGIAFKWVQDGSCEHKPATAHHHIQVVPEVLVLESVAAEGVLTSSSTAGEKRAKDDAETLAGVLQLAGLKYQRKGNAFTLPGFTRTQEEGFGKWVEGSSRSQHYRNYKRVIYPEA